MIFLYNMLFFHYLLKKKVKCGIIILSDGGCRSDNTHKGENDE